MKFLSGTNEAAITEILAHRTIAQRQRIKIAYKQTVGKVRCSKRSPFITEDVPLHLKYSNNI